MTFETLRTALLSVPGVSDVRFLTDDPDDGVVGSFERRCFGRALDFTVAHTAAGHLRFAVPNLYRLRDTGELEELVPLLATTTNARLIGRLTASPKGALRYDLTQVGGIEAALPQLPDLIEIVGGETRMVQRTLIGTVCATLLPLSADTVKAMLAAVDEEQPPAERQRLPQIAV